MAKAKMQKISNLKDTTVYSDVMTFIAKFVKEAPYNHKGYVILSPARLLDEIEKATIYDGKTVCNLLRNGFFYDESNNFLRFNGWEDMFVFKLTDF